MSHSDLAARSRVLLVGDSQAIENTATKLTAAIPAASLERVPSVEEAVTETQTPDCVVCEFQPEVATDPVASIAAQLSAVPILAVASAETAAEALASGATDVLTPETPPAVVAARVATLTNPSQRAANEVDRYHTLLASTDAVVGVLEADGEVRELSPAIEPTLGYTPADLVGTAVTSLVHPEDSDRVRGLLEEVSSGSLGDRDSERVRLGRGDGSWLVTRLTVVNRRADHTVEGIVVTISADVDPGLTPADAGLDRLEEAIITLGPAWELQYWNEAAGRVLQGEPAPGSVVWPFLPDTLASRLIDRVRKAVGTDDVTRFDTTEPAREETYRVTVTPGETGVTIVFQSIDAATADEPARLALLEETIDALADGVLILEDGAVTYANATVVAWAGGEAVVGQSLTDVFDDQLAETIRDRVTSPLVRWMEPIEGTLTLGEPTRPVAVTVAPLPREEGSVCIVREGRRSPHWLLEQIVGAVSALTTAASTSAVRQQTVEVVRDCTQAVFAGWFDGTTGRPAAVTDGDTIEPPPLEIPDSRLAALAESTHPTVSDEPTLVSAFSRAGLEVEQVTAISVPGGGVVLAAAVEPSPTSSTEATALEIVAETATAAIDRLETQSALTACQQASTELSRRSTVADALKPLVRSLLTADTRRDLERRLVEGIASLPGLEPVGVWVGRTDGNTPGVTFQESVGLSGPTEALPIDATEPDPTSIAAATGEPTLRADIGQHAETAAPLVEAWLESLRERGVRSAISLPIEYEGFRYGVFTVYAGEVGAFEEYYRAIYEHVAAVSGVAIASINRRRALLADRVTELEVLLRTPDPLAAAARALGCRLTVRSVGMRTEVGSIVYCTAEEPRENARLNETVRSLEQATVVDPERGRLELQFTEKTIADRVVAHGGVLRSVTPVEGHARLVVALPCQVPVRAFLEMLEQFYPDTELLARRERAQTGTPPETFETAVGEHLSERQLRTLETAYYAGFFEWPREQTGEEVATSLGISQPTFSRHLRTAQRKLLELLFDDE